MKGSFWSFTLPLVFLGYSVPIFLRVFTTTKQVIDEEFHIPQGLAYCNKQFHKWDDKITTFPGLYFVAIILHPFDLCSVFGLRLISLLAATVNIGILFKIKCLLLPPNDNSNNVAAFEALTIAALPPLYFFSHVYYSDAISLTMVLTFYYFWLKNSHLMGAVYAASSVLMRQTNVVWVAMAIGIDVLDILKMNYAKQWKDKREITFWDIQVWMRILSSFKLIMKCIWQILYKDCFYLIIVLPFVGFVFINGSIVLGDKSAHQATLHIPQLFYFTLFTMCFAIANNVEQLPKVLKFIRKHKVTIALMLLAGLLIVHYNTMVHKYLLADNRHYAFYVWNRFYGRYFWFKYAMVPVYVVGLLLIYSGISHTRESFKILFFVAVVIALCFQRLLEFRYFLVPFVIFRLQTQPSSRYPWVKWVELGSYLFLNALTFYIFFTKEIKWSNYSEPQRIIW